MAAELVRVLDINPHDKVVDLGCSNGAAIMHFALKTGAKCVGVDINEDLIK